MRLLASFEISGREKNPLDRGMMEVVVRARSGWTGADADANAVVAGRMRRGEHDSSARGSDRITDRELDAVGDMVRG